MYESNYRRVTSQNWEFVKREAKHHIECFPMGIVVHGMNYPCKVLFDQFHNDRPIEVTFDQCLIDDSISVCELNEWSP